MSDWRNLDISRCPKLLDGLNDALEQYRFRAANPAEPVVDFDAGSARLWFRMDQGRNCYDAELELTPAGRQPVVVRFTLKCSQSFLIYKSGFTCRGSVSADDIETISARPFDPTIEVA